MDETPRLGAKLGPGEFEAMNIGNLIRRARRAARLSQRELATQLGVHPSAVGQWELNQSQPDVGHRIEISVLLGIRFTDLLPELGGRVVLVTDPDEVAIVRLVQQMTPEQRAALLRAIALLMDRPGESVGAASVRLARERKSAKAS